MGFSTKGRNEDQAWFNKAGTQSVRLCLSIALERHKRDSETLLSGDSPEGRDGMMEGRRDSFKVRRPSEEGRGVEGTQRDVPPGKGQVDGWKEETLARKDSFEV